jgi:ubiquinone/menaquinone biosynthesis C-methylase UbiE
MNETIRRHYSREPMLADAILSRLVAAGKDPSRLTIDDLAPIDEFHVRGRKATLELADRMEIDPQARVLDLGSGLGGPARTLAQVFGCQVVGIDLTPALCEAAAAMSGWVGLAGKVSFEQGDATALDCEPRSFDAVMTIHAAMNVAAKDAMYAGAHRALKPGRIFAIYDILQGDGGDVLYPVPWARDASISHLATAAQMRELLHGAGFSILDEIDSSDESLAWFEQAAQAAARSAPLSFRSFLGPDHVQMARNQVRNLAERRIRTISYICRR